jgi:hypothetical protein
MYVGDRFDGDDDLVFKPAGAPQIFLRRNTVVALRDHLTTVLGDSGKTPSSPLSRSDALATAEALVGKLAEATDRRTGLMGVGALALEDRVSAILRVADFLIGETRDLGDEEESS